MCSSPAHPGFSRHQTTIAAETRSRIRQKCKYILAVGTDRQSFASRFFTASHHRSRPGVGPLSDQNENKIAPDSEFSHFGELSVSTAAEMNFIFFAPCLRSVLMAHHDLTAGAEIISINCGLSAVEWRWGGIWMMPNAVIPDHYRDCVGVAVVDGVVDRAVSFARRGRAGRAGR
jgi:hypothetical protein